MKTIYFVLGMHRSGTSALSGVLNIMGLDFGTNLMQGDSNNPKGYYENNFVYGLNENILKEAQSSWDDYNFDINKISTEKKEFYINNIIELVNDEFKYSEKFVVKDPRICILFPLWEEACLRQEIEIKVILPYRNPIEVAQSLKNRNNFSHEKSLLIWSKHFFNAEYLSRKYSRIFVFFEDLIKEQATTAKIISDFTNFEIKEITKNEIVQFLDKNIKHNNISLKNFSKEVPSFLYELIEIIKNKDFSNEKILDKCRNDFHYSLSMFQHIEMENKLKEEIFQRKLLESISDLSSIDENYYIDKYEDIKNYNGPIKEHYFKYGKQEGRYPNLYCEINNIETKEIISKDELIYQKDLNIQDLNVKKENLENEYNQKVQEIDSLNKNIEDILNDLQTVKNAKQVVKDELNVKIDENNSLTEQNSNLTNTIQDLNVKKENLENEYNQKVQEIDSLNKNIDEIVSDLASIKESKCWIYTKPIRNLQKTLKGK